MGLICWLPLDGNTENYGASLVAPINHGAVINNGGKIGKCYSFNGNDQYISLAGQQLFNCFKGGSTPFSICMWIYHGDSRRAILFGDYATTNSINFNIELSTEHVIRFYWSGNPDYSPTEINIGANTWNHIAITYDGSTLTSYLNGIEKTTRSGTLVELNKTAGEFRLGRDNRTTDTAFNGRLNDIRIYDHALSAAEIHEISQGLILHYKLDELTNGKIEDSSGYNHNGTVSGTLNFSLDTPRYSACANFNGTDTRIQVPNLTPYELTISFWMKRNANTETRQFMYTAWDGITCELQTNGTSTFAVNRSSYPTITGTTITTNSDWIHYCATFDTTNGSKLYENGVLKSSNSNTTPITYNITTNYIGYYSTYYSGKMSDFRIYCTALSATDIKQLYELGAKIDNKQNLHIYEGIEAQSAMQLTKHGQMKVGEFQEDTHTKFYKTDLVIKTNNLIEL